MPVDWDEFEKDLDDIVTGAAKRTDDRLAGRIAAVCRLSSDDVKTLFPEAADAKKLGELMAIVNGATARNEKIVQIVKNAEKFAGIVLTLMQKFA